MPQPQSRWMLYLQAVWWRSLMRLAMVLHNISRPKPPSPSFSQRIPTNPKSQSITLQFYVPNDFYNQRREGRRYPVVVNLHGGGFCLGTATDDGYWARQVLEKVDAVFVSVEYRLAPEFPFPAAVDDGVEALLYLADNAEELGLDASKVALSGFSAGGNLAFTVAMRLQDYTMTGSDNALSRLESTGNLLKGGAISRTSASSPTLGSLQIVAITVWYPIVDFTVSRDERRAASVRPEKTLPRFFTSLFDQSYLTILADRSSPYVSPLHAPDEMLIHGLPNNIDMKLAEWDMLLMEGKRFTERLQSLGKNARCTLIKGVPHAWDKSPNPFRDQASIDVLYGLACLNIREAFESIK